jgi:hypothetical protein
VVLILHSLLINQQRLVFHGLGAAPVILLIIILPF